MELNLQNDPERELVVSIDTAHVRASRAESSRNFKIVVARCGRPRLEQVRDARSRFAARGGNVSGALNCEKGKSAAPVSGFDAIGSASLI